MFCFSPLKEVSRVPSMSMLPLGNTSITRTVTWATICSEFLIVPPPLKVFAALYFRAGIWPPLVSRPLATGLYKKAVMAASMEAFLLVEVALSLLAVVFSCTTIVMRSPTREARLSENIGLEIPSCQRDWAEAVSPAVAQARRAQENRETGRVAFILQRDQYIFRIEDLALEIPPRKRVAHANELAGDAILQRLDFQSDHQCAVLHHRCEALSPVHNGAGPHHAGKDRRAGLDGFVKFQRGIAGRKIGQR